MNDMSMIKKIVKFADKPTRIYVANAIILQAVRDYRCSTDKNKKFLEKFFLSGWFTVLTKLDGQMLVERLRKEGNNKNGKSNSSNKPERRSG